ncbi:MAG: SBBP repeat-containing protein [Phycisphaerales bacterium]|nr:SBBP repeat-containing protein [Phycisphaerales bacterium]
MPFHSAAALTLLAAAAFAVAAPPAAMDGRYQPPDPVGRAVERFSLGLRGVYFVENRGQWSDGSVCFGLKSRGLDVAFRESSFTMHLSRECASTSRAREEAGFAPSPGSAGEGRGGGELLHHTNYESNLSLEREALLPHGRGSSVESVAYEHLTLTVSFPGSNAVTPRGAQPQEAKFNYFVGGEGRGTASNVPSFGAVVYENLYNGIDLLVTGNDDGVMKYEFHCEPGADYSQIRIHYDGIDSLCVNDDGDLEIATRFGTLRDGAPIVWQEEDGSTSRAREEAGFCQSPGSARGEHGRTAGEGRGGGDSATRALEQAGCSATSSVHQNPLLHSRGSSDSTIPARFELIDATTYRVAVNGPVDTTRPLIIDPDLQWMLYLGGSGSVDYAYSASVDASGDTWVTGETESRDFEGRTNESQGWDAFVARVASSGTLTWMTYLGGRGVDQGRSIALNSENHSFVAGNTNSLDFEGRTNSNHAVHLADDGFILRVDSTGTLLWMTYLGGGLADGANGVSVDDNGDALVTGTTPSEDFEGRINSLHGRSDAYVAKVDADGSLQWMTYLGGSEDDYAGDLDCDSAGDVICTGQTASNDFEGRINEYHGEHSDVYVLSVDASGGVQWMTYVGGSSNEYGTDIARDGDGSILVTGATLSADFDGRLNSRNRRGSAFLFKMNSIGTVMWMVYLGGSNVEEGHALAVDAHGDAYVTGITLSDDFYLRLNSLRGESDAFVASVDSAGSERWMYYVGGGDAEVANAVNVTGEGDAYVVGHTTSHDFPGRLNEHHGGWHDVFVVRLGVVRPALSVFSSCPSGGPVRADWSGGTPQGPAVLLFAQNIGQITIPDGTACAGSVLGLGSRRLQIARRATNDPAGSGSVNANAGPGACGGYLQLLDLATCGTSNVARIE